MSKKVNSKKVEKEGSIKDYLVKYKKEIAIGAVLLIAVIVCIVFLFVNNGDNDNENENSNTGNEIENVVITEEEIVGAYGVTKEDAIALVKQSINSDNFEFTVTISSEAKYIVTVKNTLTDAIYKYEVDPMTKQYYEI